MNTSVGRTTIVIIGDFVNMTYPGVKARGCYAVLYLLLAKKYPELAQATLDDALDDPALLHFFEEALDSLVELATDNAVRSS